jgi:hypothetical protein
VITILTGVRGNLSVVLIWPGMVNIFHESFLAIWTSSFEKVLFSSVAHFFIGSLILWEFGFLSYLYTLVISPLFDV